jgi:hypothetical protein
VTPRRARLGGPFQAPAQDARRTPPRTRRPCLLLPAAPPPDIINHHPSSIYIIVVVVSKKTPQGMQSIGLPTTNSVHTQFPSQIGRIELDRFRSCCCWALDPSSSLEIDRIGDDDDGRISRSPCMHAWMTTTHPPLPSLHSHHATHLSHPPLHPTHNPRQRGPASVWSVGSSTRTRRGEPGSKQRLLSERSDHAALLGPRDQEGGCFVR